jgi:hypothetical protein
MSNPADDIKDIFNGISSLAKGLGEQMQNNDLIEKILIAWMISKNFNMQGYSLRHFNRDGMLEFKAKAHSVQNGVQEDTLYHISRVKLTQWASVNRPDLLPQQSAPVRPIIQINK